MDRRSFYYLTTFLGALLAGLGVYFISYPRASPQELLGISVAIEDTTITLDDKELWQDSGIRVEPGDKVYISASGRVMWSKDKTSQKWTSPDGEACAPAAMTDKSGFPN